MGRKVAGPRLEAGVTLFSAPCLAAEKGLFARRREGAKKRVLTESAEDAEKKRVCSRGGAEGAEVLRLRLVEVITIVAEFRAAFGGSFFLALRSLCSL